MNLPETDLHGLIKSTIYGAIRQIIIFRPPELNMIRNTYDEFFSKLSG